MMNQMKKPWEMELVMPFRFYNPYIDIGPHVTNTLERIAKMESERGRTVERGLIGSVILPFDGGEIHMVPTKDGINEFFFKYKNSNKSLHDPDKNGHYGMCPECTNPMHVNQALSDVDLSISPSGKMHEKCRRELEERGYSSRHVRDSMRYVKYSEKTDSEQKKSDSKCTTALYLIGKVYEFGKTHLSEFHTNRSICGETLLISSLIGVENLKNMDCERCKSIRFAGNRNGAELRSLLVSPERWQCSNCDMWFTEEHQYCPSCLKRDVHVQKTADEMLQALGPIFHRNLS